MDPLEVYKHYGCQQDKAKVECGEYPSVDFNIFKESAIQEITANMVGFGTDQSQMVIIEYDKGYGYFLIKRIPKEYGAPHGAPPET